MCCGHHIERDKNGITYIKKKEKVEKQSFRKIINEHGDQ